MRPSEYGRPGLRTVATVNRPMPGRTAAELRVATGSHRGSDFVYVSLWGQRGEGQDMEPVTGLTLRASEAHAVGTALATLEPSRSRETRPEPTGPVRWDDALRRE